MIRLHSTSTLKTTARRRGAVFHYYLMYMLLTSILLSAAGFSLHAVLDADQIDRRVAQHLKTLLKFDRSLREDLLAVSNCDVKNGKLQMADSKVTVTWEIEDNRVARTKSLNGEVDGRNTFVFPKGTSVSWSADGVFTTITITEAPIRIGGKPAPSAAQPKVQIVLPRKGMALDSVGKGMPLDPVGVVNGPTWDIAPPSRSVVAHVKRGAVSVERVTASNHKMEGGTL